MPSAYDTVKVVTAVFSVSTAPLAYAVGFSKSVRLSLSLVTKPVTLTVSAGTDCPLLIVTSATETFSVFGAIVNVHTSLVKSAASFGLADKDAFLTNAGKLLADQHIVYNSQLFCIRWIDLEKGSIFDDALDDKKYEGNLIHRDLIIMGSEIHIDTIGSVRRTPIIADLFHQVKFMERRGSGLKKILSEIAKLPGYSEQLKLEFYSTPTDFRVVLKNVNCNLRSGTVQDRAQVAE